MITKIIFIGDLSNSWNRSHARLSALEKKNKNAEFITRNWNNKSKIHQLILRIYLKTKLSIFVPIYILFGINFGKNTLLWIDNFPMFPSGSIKIFKVIFPLTRIIFYSEDNFMLEHNYHKLHRSSLDYYDKIFTTKDYIFSNLRNYTSLVKLSDSYDERMVNFPRNYQYKYDVSFIGTFEKERYLAMQYLANNGIKVNIFGSGWEGISEKNLIHKKPIFGETFFEVINSSRINLIFLRKANFDNVTSRSIELPALYGFFLAEYSKKHYEIYGTEKVLFKSHAELKLLVNQWLSRSDDVRSNALNQIRQHIMTQKLSIQDQIDHVMREL